MQLGLATVSSDVPWRASLVPRLRSCRGRITPSTEAHHVVMADAPEWVVSQFGGIYSMEPTGADVSFRPAAENSVDAREDCLAAGAADSARSDPNVDKCEGNVTNALYYGDNLGYLREMDRSSVDLVYLDPPFNSKATYNLLFKSPKGGTVEAQTTAFKDTWTWDIPAEMAFDEAMASGSPAAGILRAFRGFLGDSDVMAYLAMMVPRLIHLHRVLKQTGSLYLHCDSTASHYLKLILDGIFGPDGFRNEIIWKRSHAHSDARQGARHFGRITDAILFYAKSVDAPFNQLHQPYDQKYIDRDYRRIDADGRRYRLDNIQGPGGAAKGNPFYDVMGVSRYWRYKQERMNKLIAEGRIIQTRPGAVPQYKRYLDEMPGMPLQNLWTDMPGINNRSKEVIGYPTQKPIALLQRIISASSNKGDSVLDPFCGCGTTIEAAEVMGRQWIGIDITHHAIDVIEGRLHRLKPDADYQVKGRPADPASARRLAERDPYEFQWWSNWMLGVQNYRERKKGADKGIDGIIYFHNPPHGVGQVIVSVKAGQHINPDMISALEGTVKREDAQLGVFVCAAEPTANIRRNAAAMGIARIGREQYPRVQIVTADELLTGPLPRLPRPIESDAFRQPLRPPLPTKVATPQPQLSFALPIPGMKGKRSDVQDHLAGGLLAELAAGR
jgi:DNA modification methylase